jgi:hypothetical protein
MATRSRGPLAGFGWLARGIEIGFDHPKPIFGAAALLMLASLIPAAITLPVQFHAQQMGTQANPALVAWIIGVPLLFNLLLLPLHAGYLRLIDAVEHEMPPRVASIFSLYGKKEAWKVIGYGLALIVCYVIAIAIAVATTGGGVARWYMETLNARTNHLVSAPALPDGFGITIVLMFVLFVFLMGAHSIALNQIVQRRRGVFAAIGDGIIGALKNLLPLLMFVVGAVLAAVVAAIGFFFIAMLFGLIGKLISVWLMFAFIVPLYIALFLLMIAFTYAVMYHIWYDVCGDDEMPGMAEPLAA